MTLDLGSWESLLQMIAASAALGTAAFGLVDVSKVVRNGLPSAGFGHLLKVFNQLPATFEAALASREWRDQLKAFWIGGLPKDEQKANLRALVRLGFSDQEPVIAELAAFANLEPAPLKAIAGKMARGATLTDKEVNLLGRLDATIDARIDAAFELADQAYRNWARASAAIVAVALAAIAGAVMGVGAQMWIVLGLGVIAVPLAPIAKDLSSALSAAARVAGSVRPGGV